MELEVIQTQIFVTSIMNDNKRRKLRRKLDELTGSVQDIVPVRRGNGWYKASAKEAFSQYVHQV